MSYNVENLFDAEDDPEIEDEEFLPDSRRHWTNKRYAWKLNQIGRAITLCGEKLDTPALIGLCEVENDSVMTRLVTRTALGAHPYRYCISDKSDVRGIRVALIYRRDVFGFIGHRSIRIPVRGRPTRHLLHVWGKVANGDTLDIIVCHFPSKSGSANMGEPNRLRAAASMSRLCDSLSVCRQSPSIIAMGDFNDTPDSECLKQATGAYLCNLFNSVSDRIGSYKYRGRWEQIDYILIHCGMKNVKSRIRFVPNSQSIISLPFLLKDEKDRMSKRPHKTFNGGSYEGGFSDHLPVAADFFVSPVR